LFACFIPTLEERAFLNDRSLGNEMDCAPSPEDT